MTNEDKVAVCVMQRQGSATVAARLDERAYGGAECHSARHELVLVVWKAVQTTLRGRCPRLGVGE